MGTQVSVYGKYVLPFIQWYALMIGIAILADYILHRLGLTHIGIYLGYAGTFLILVSFVYSLRKRKIITSGSPKKLLEVHEYVSWVGAICIIVHAGIHFNAILPWAALLCMLVAVASGLTGKFLLKNASEDLKHKKSALQSTGATPEEIQKAVFFDALYVDAMKKWRSVHMPITLLLGLLSAMHILTTMIFSR